MPKTPKAQAEAITTGEKVAFGFDAVMFVLTAVSLVMNVLNYITTEEALHKQIDALNEKVKQAKLSASKVLLFSFSFFSLSILFNIVAFVINVHGSFQMMR